MITLKQDVNIALGYFFIAGLLGIILRLFFVTPIPANFRYVVHAHSHIALLGWVYLALVSLIYKMYFPEKGINSTYKKIFWFTNITLLGMLFTFPFTGYALFSIIFSTLFLFASYWAAWFFFKRIPKAARSTNSFTCIKASLIYLIISSIGPWAIGAVMATLGNTSIWYKLSIYFYLHFQYNAWFILALLGIFFYLLESWKFVVDPKKFRIFFILVNLAVIFSFFLSVLWVDPPIIIYLLAAFGAILQVLAFYEFFRIVKMDWDRLKIRLSPFVRLLLKISWILLVIKVFMQLLTAIPFFAELSFTYMDFVIGYLHLIFLGLISLALFAFLIQFKLLKLKKSIFGIYFTGFVLSESLIFYKGLAIWLGLPFFSQYFPLLAGISFSMPLAVGLLLIQNLKTSLK